MLIIKSAAKKRLSFLRKCVISTATTALMLLMLPAQADVLGPIFGPPTLLGTTSFNLADVGYRQSEYFVSGMAKSYTNTTPLTSDGKWSVAVADQAFFRTRFVVYQPIDPAKFNGTVVIEWLNVSGGAEASSQWIMAHTEMIRKGYAWVGISAQKAGIDGGGANVTGLPLHLKLINPLRYLALVHPGDKYAYDIFSQAAKAAAKPALSAPNPLSGLQVKRVIAAGESQSADFLLTYANAVAPIEKIFNGYFIHSRVHGSASLLPTEDNSIANFATRATVKLRDDLDVPAMMLMTETDLTVLGALADRQNDSSNVRVWEIAGAAHADYYVSHSGLSDKGNDPNIAAVVEEKSAVPIFATCDTPINAGPQHFVINAAVAALDNWLRYGFAPAYVPRLQLTGTPAAYVRDSVGNALGGARTPYVDAPIATLSGEGGSGSTLCTLFGSTHLLSNTQLMSLYPNHATYVAAVNSAADSAVLKGVLLTPDSDLIKAWAAASAIGNY